MSGDSTRDLRQLGWDSFFEREFELVMVADWIPARVVSETRGHYRYLVNLVSWQQRLSKMRYEAGKKSDIQRGRLGGCEAEGR